MVALRERPLVEDMARVAGADDDPTRSAYGCDRHKRCTLALASTGRGVPCCVSVLAGPAPLRLLRDAGCVDDVLAGADTEGLAAVLEGEQPSGYGERDDAEEQAVEGDIRLAPSHRSPLHLGRLESLAATTPSASCPPPGALLRCLEMAASAATKHPRSTERIAPAVAVVAAGHPARRRLVQALRRAQLDVVADAANIEELAVRELDVVVVQHNDAHAAAELRTLVKRDPQARVVCVVSEPAWKTVRGLLREGATGVVSDAEIAEALPLAVASAHAGQLTLPSRLRSEIAQPVLSVREKQTLAMVVMGFSNPEISRKLYVAESTVKSHLSSAFAKLGVRSRNEATALILDPEHGLGTGILEISGDTHEAGLAPVSAA